MGPPKQDLFGCLNLKVFKDMFFMGRNIFSKMTLQSQVIQFDLSNNDMPYFKHIIIWQGDFEWNNYFLPDAIILSDSRETQYSDTYYYVARIGKELDFRKVEKNSAVDWKSSINKSVSLENIEKDDWDLWNKLSCSFFLMYDNVRDLATQEIFIQPKIVSDKMSNDKIESLKSLTQICGWSEIETTAFCDYLITSKIEKEEHPYEILSLTEDYCYDVQEGHKLLFMYFDWKESVEEFIWKLDKVLKLNYNIAEPIPLGNYTKDNQILEDGVLEHFDTYLKSKALQLTSIETDGDDYLFVVHSVDSFQKVKELIVVIGWDVSEI